MHPCEELAVAFALVFVLVFAFIVIDFPFDIK
jgi:hypothetical protein